MPELAIALALHVLAAVVWVGGMAFAYAILRPAAEQALAGPERLTLWRGTFSRFFPTVWVAVGVILATGYGMVFGAFGGFAGVGVDVHIMHALGLVMVAVFAHVFFAPWRRFRRALDRADRAAAAGELARIRRLVAINLTLGLVVVAVAASGRYWGV